MRFFAGVSTKVRKTKLIYVLFPSVLFFSSVSFAVVPAAPASLTAPSNTNAYTVALSWSSVPYATTYVVEKQKDGGTWSTAYSGSSYIANISLPYVHGLYYFRVKACAGLDCSGYTYSGQTIVINQAPDSYSRRVIYIHTDVLGSPSAETNQTGNLTPTY